MLRLACGWILLVLSLCALLFCSHYVMYYLCHILNVYAWSQLLLLYYHRVLHILRSTSKHGVCSLLAVCLWRLLCSYYTSVVWYVFIVYTFFSLWIFLLERVVFSMFFASGLFLASARGFCSLAKWITGTALGSLPSHTSSTNDNSIFRSQRAYSGFSRTSLPSTPQRPRKTTACVIKPPTSILTSAITFTERHRPH